MNLERDNFAKQSPMFSSTYKLARKSTIRFKSCIFNLFRTFLRIFKSHFSSQPIYFLSFAHIFRSLPGVGGPQFPSERAPIVGDHLHTQCGK